MKKYKKIYIILGILLFIYILISEIISRIIYVPQKNIVENITAQDYYNSIIGKVKVQMNKWDDISKELSDRINGSKKYTEWDKSL